MALSGDEPVRGFFKLLLSPPTRWGQVIRQAWAQELPFPKLSDRAVTADPEELRQPWLMPWIYGGTEVEPHFRALTLTSELQWNDHWMTTTGQDATYVQLIADLATALSFPRGGSTPIYWKNLAGTFEPTNPSGYSDTIWLATRTHASQLGGLARCEMTSTWPAETSFSIIMHRWSPLLTRTQAAPFRPYARVTLGQSDQHVNSGIIINLPMRMPAQGGLDFPAPRAQVFRAGSTNTMIAEFDSAAQASLAADMSPTVDVVTIRSMEQGVYLVGLSGSDTPALIVDSTLALEAATVTVDFVASHGAFAFVAHEYTTGGVATKLTPGVWPAWSGAENGEMILRTSEPDGTSVATDLQESNITSIDPDNPATTQPKLTLSTTDQYYTPVVWYPEERHPAVKGDPDGSVVDYSSWFDRWIVRERTDGRANTATFFPTDDEVELSDLNGNEWAEVWLGHQWPDLSLAADEALLVQVMSGPVSLPRTKRDGDNRDGKSQTLLQIGTWMERFQDGRDSKKPMANHAGVSFQDRPIEETVRYILDGKGVPPELISFDSIDPAVLAELTLPNERPWERRYAYAFETSAIEALNDLLAAVSLRFRITRQGVFDCFFPAAYSGIPDHTITDSEGAHIDLLESIETDRRSKGLRNWVLHIGQDRDGNSVIGITADSASIYDPTSPRYIGDDWWSVVFDPGNPNAEVTAGIELERRRRWQVAVRWTWAGHPAWEVGDTVEIDVGGIRLPRGSVVEILEKRSVGRADTLAYEETITAGLLETP